jgi:hypothetical protein
MWITLFVLEPLVVLAPLVMVHRNFFAFIMPHIYFLSLFFFSMDHILSPQAYVATMTYVEHLLFLFNLA